MEWVEGTRFGWVLGGLFMVAFGAVCYWIYKRIMAQREKKGGKL
jgi:hypothetical protein